MTTRVAEARRGMVLRLDGEIYQITGRGRVAPGDRRAMHHLDLVNLRTGLPRGVRLASSDPIELVPVAVKECPYVYRDAIGLVFMDSETYVPFHLPEAVAADSTRYFVEGDRVGIGHVDGRPMSISLPAAVVLEVTGIEDVPEGEAFGGRERLAVVATGHELRVPARVEVGDRVRVSTETGEFLGRVEA